MSVPGVGLQVNKFKEDSSDDHQKSVAGGLGVGMSMGGGGEDTPKT